MGAVLPHSMSQVYDLTSNLNLWFKIQANEEATIADYPGLIPFRWEYFRDQWEFIKKDYIQKIDSYDNPDMLKRHISTLSQFIDAQRHTKNNPFSKRDILFTFFAIFDVTPVSQYPLTQEEDNIIADKRNVISRWTRDDFVLVRNKLIVFRDQYADIRGLTDEQYNKTYKRSAVAQQTNATNFDMNQLGSMNVSIKNIDFILANQFALKTAFIDPFAQARANTNNPDIDIRNYQNGNLVKVNYNQDLRGLARQYMGDEERWIEIAIANGLKPPYIDEVGERVPLISNGSDNKIILAGTDSMGRLTVDKLHVNQVVFIQSDSQTFPDQRIIINIEQIPISNEVILELDGEPNLGDYKLSANAHLRVFKPNTINSSFYVLIPSNEANQDARKDITPWFLNTSGEDEKRMKVDLTLDEKGDISFDNSADLNLSYGIENAVQAVKLKMGVQEGELSQHVNFGLTTLLGRTNTDKRALQETLRDSISQQIEADPRFDRIETLEIVYAVNVDNYDAPAGFNISMTVKIAGSDQVIPISFRINA